MNKPKDRKIDLTAAIKFNEEQISTDRLKEIIISSIQDRKGKEIVEIDLREIPEAPTDFFIICEGDSFTQVKAISENIQKTLKDNFQIYPNHTEGTQGAKWVLVDYFDVVVHVFHPDTRSFYEIEELWSDAKVESVSA